MRQNTKNVIKTISNDIEVTTGLYHLFIQSIDKNTGNIQTLLFNNEEAIHLRDILNHVLKNEVQ